MDQRQTTSLRQWFVGDVGDLPRILLLDGGVSTHLEETLRCKEESENKAAPTTSVFPFRELWSSGLLLSSEGSDSIASGHGDWLQAGANVISTVTYQCHYECDKWPKREANGLLSPVLDMTTMDRMWRDGISLARQAVQEYEDQHTGTDHKPHFVVASSGCYGACLANGAEYTGSYNLPDDSALAMLHNFHLLKLQAAKASHPDGIAIETVPSLLECRALCNLLDRETNEVGSPIAYYISLACRSESELNDGTSLEQSLSVFRNVPVNRLHAIGVNCCDVKSLPGLLTTLVMEISQYTPNRGIVVYPNSGESWDAVNEQWIDGTGVCAADEMAQKLMKCILHIERAWHSMTQNQSSFNGRAMPPSILIGGCCRTRPATIAALRRLVDAHLASA